MGLFSRLKITSFHVSLDTVKISHLKIKQHFERYDFEGFYLDLEKQNVLQVPGSTLLG